jgi:hypothetical protein
VITGDWAHIATGRVDSVTGGVSRIRWTPSCESTSTLYNFDLMLGSTNTASVRGKGRLRLESTLIGNTNTQPRQYTVIDCALVSWLNPGASPFTTTAGATNFPWSYITNPPTTLAGYGITDPVSTQGHQHVVANITDAGTAARSNVTAFATAAQGAQAGTAFGWGNHASAGYSTNKLISQALAYSTNNLGVQSITNAGDIQSAGNISASGTCLVVTGTITPDATGTYLATLPYNGYPCFVLGTTYVIWYDTVNSDYWITTAAQKGNSRPNGWWRYSTTCTGTYAHLDPPYTGTATATATPAFGNISGGEYLKYSTNLDLLYESLVAAAAHSNSNAPGVHGTGTAASSNVEAFATAAQGAKADTSIQSGFSPTDTLARAAITTHSNMAGTAVHGLGTAALNNTGDFLPSGLTITDATARAWATFSSNGVLELNGLTNGYNCAITNLSVSYGTNDAMSITGKWLYVCFNTNVSSSAGTTNLFAGSGSTGLVTSAGGDAGKYLKADGTWATPASGGGGDIYSTNNNVFSGSNILGITTFTNVPTVNGTPVSTSTTAAASSTYDERTNIAAIAAISLQTNIVVGSAKPIIPDFAVWASSTSAFNQVMLVNIWESTNVASARLLREYESLVYVTTFLSTITNVAAGTNIITPTAVGNLQSYEYIMLQQNAGANACEWAYVTNRGSTGILYLKTPTINTYTGGLATISRIGIYSPQQYINTLGQSLLPCTFTFPYAPTVTVTTLLKEIY